MYEKGVSTGVNAENRASIEKETRFASTLSTWHQESFVDPQTSGGLLVSLPAAQGDTLLNALRDKGVEAACIIGTVAELKDETYLTFS